MKYRTLAVALLLLLTGCGTNPPEPGPSETPAPSTSQSADPLYEEAVAVAKAIDEIDRKYLYQNKYDPFPAEEYSEYAAGDFLAASEALYKQSLDLGKETLDIEKAEIKYKYFPDISKDGSEIALLQCMDGSNAKFRENGDEKFGGKSQSVYFFKHIDGKLKAFTSKSEKESACDW